MMIHFLNAHLPQVKKGLMSKLSDSFDARKSTYPDSEEFFQKERDWVAKYQPAIANTSEAFNKITCAQLSKCGVPVCMKYNNNSLQQGLLLLLTSLHYWILWGDHPPKFKTFSIFTFRNEIKFKQRAFGKPKMMKMHWLVSQHLKDGSILFHECFFFLDIQILHIKHLSLIIHDYYSW